MRIVILLISLFFLESFLPNFSSAAEKPRPANSPTPTAASEEEAAEAVDVSKITEKYWAQGKETELGVVQNRKYTSSKRFELGLFVGTISTDPFLDVRHYGTSLGYHFNQYFSLHGFYWKAVVSESDAQASFRAQGTGSSVNTNPPKAFYGVQGNYDFLYGKASLFGSTIIYVDLFVLGGFGINDTTTGKNFTPFIGLGQNIHLNQHMALHLDWRMMFFKENVLSQGQLRERSNNTNAITLGLSFFN